MGQTFTPRPADPPRTDRFVPWPHLPFADLARLLAANAGHWYLVWETGTQHAGQTMRALFRRFVPGVEIETRIFDYPRTRVVQIYARLPVAASMVG